MSSPRTVIIDTLAFGGSGVCRIDGKVCFVPFSCPGDEAAITVTSQKRSYMMGRISEILFPSPMRTSPVCPLFGLCGGCNWQHVGYAYQLEAKRKIHAEALWRGARVENDLVSACLPSLKEYGYRRRVQFKLHASGDRLHIGFFRQGTHFVEDAPQGCPIAMPVINESLDSLRRVLEFFPEPENIPQINFESGDDGCVATINYIGSSPAKAATFFSSNSCNIASLSALFLQTGRKSTLTKIYGDPLIHYTMPGSTDKTYQLGFRPGSFSQVNGEQNRTMMSIVRKMASITGNEHILDLYCGNGNFSIPLAAEAASVTGIEEYPDSIASAIDNCHALGILNAEYICSDAASGIASLLADGRLFDVVIIDPPRAGAPDAAAVISGLKPGKIIYISCDSSTLARDCGILSGRGYRVTESVPLDMFPHTHHIESVTLLCKSS